MRLRKSLYCQTSKPKTDRLETRFHKRELLADSNRTRTASMLSLRAGTPLPKLKYAGISVGIL